MKKIFVSITILMFAFLLTGCDDIKEIVNEVENMIIEESLNTLAEEVGIEGFELPEYEDLSIEFMYDQESDISKLALDIEKPGCEFDEYKNQLVGYVEDALSDSVDVETVDFEPTPIENGYLWEYTYEEELEDGSTKEVVVLVKLVNDQGDFKLDLELTNLGDIFASMQDQIEEGTQEEGTPEE